MAIAGKDLKIRKAPSLDEVYDTGRTVGGVMVIPQYSRLGRILPDGSNESFIQPPLEN